VYSWHSNREEFLQKARHCAEQSSEDGALYTGVGALAGTAAAATSVDDDDDSPFQFSASTPEHTALRERLLQHEREVNPSSPSLPLSFSPPLSPSLPSPCGTSSLHPHSSVRL
jgi:hypothetical protein